MRQSLGETSRHGPGPPLAAMRGVPRVQMGIVVSAQIYVHVRVWPPCTFAPPSEGSAIRFFCAFSEGLRGGTVPDDVGVSSRGFTCAARLARLGCWGFQRARSRGLGGRKRLDAWVPNASDALPASSRYVQVSERVLAASAGVRMAVVTHCEPLPNCHALS